jgi:membrane-bound lytic murein transglycosylase A
MRAIAGLCLALLAADVTRAEGTAHTILPWDALEGWHDDDHAEALAVFRETCTDLTEPEWATLCAVAGDQTDARTFFELFFRPVLVEDGEPALFTGYYEPELHGSRHRSERYRYPLYSTPPEVVPGELWHSRAEIEQLGILHGRGLEIVWIDDPVDAFFLQIQGSGRITLEEGGAVRVGYDGRNGHEYRSVGMELVRRGVFEQHQVSASVIRNWVRDNPAAGEDLLRHNPSYIFFREVSDVPAESGPLGAMNRSITTLRSIAVDPDYVPLGAPVWIEKDGGEPMNRLMIAQDTGSAIKGAQRVDIFFGTGPEAGKRAGQIKDPGRAVVLLPIRHALDLVPGG